MNSASIELWGGVECTVNRIGDGYMDQLEASGHARRLGDLDRFAELGLRTLRYPILWERVAPAGPDRADWSWPDERLGRMRTLGIRPVVGLLHHGSGPLSTSLVDPAFPEGLAAFARAVATRYPWVDAYTPVNEPLTTARFSGLYGHWFPHARDDRTFCQALLNQCRAVVLSMRAIRSVNSAARLVQTEDLGKTHSTPNLTYQADFENQRRWLTWDLLCGRVHQHHPMWSFFMHAGIAERDVAWFVDNPCPPDVIGVNHYLSGERILDERLEHHAAVSLGGNGRARYADVLAARVLIDGQVGLAGLLSETWARYGRPMAVTEAHNGSTREEQMRWLMDVWTAAGAAREAGVDVRAVCVWALLGSFNWDVLVTRDIGSYEVGAFDVRSPEPRPTAIAQMVRDLAAGGAPDHPVLASPGWWRRADRFQHPPLHRQRRKPEAFDLSARNVQPVRPLLITGARGTLGRAFGRICEARGLAYVLLDRQQLDITSYDSVLDAVDRFQPWAIVNAAGYVRVDDAEADEEACFRLNAIGPAVLAEVCGMRGARLLTFSSDLVMDGLQDAPYTERSQPAPLGAYGRSKAEAERRVLASSADALVVRTSAFFGPWDQHNFVTIALAALAAGETFRAVDDLTVSPTYVPDLVHASLDLLIDGEQGIWHLANHGGVTWLELAQRAAVQAGVGTNGLEGCAAADVGYVATRPRNSALISERGWVMPTLDDALRRYVVDRAAFAAEPHRRGHEGTASALSVLLQALR